MKVNSYICLISLLSFVISINGDGYVKIKMKAYRNYYGRRSSQRRCDGWSKCDFMFEISSMVKNKNNIEAERKISTLPRHDQNIVIFGSFLSNTENNPFILKFKRWTGTFALSTYVHDHDTFTDHDLVDIFTFTRNVDSDGKIHREKLRSPFHQHQATLTFEFSVHCNRFFYSPSCTKYCKPSNNNSGHYSCNKLGEKECLKGWKNPARNCVTKQCDDRMCHNHGTCKMVLGHPQCHCKKNFRGRRCEYAYIRYLKKSTTEIRKQTKEQITSNKAIITQTTQEIQTTTDKQVTKRKPENERETTPEITSTDNHNQTTVFYGAAAVNSNGGSNQPRKIARFKDSKVNIGIDPAFLAIPLVLIVLLFLIGTMYLKRRKLHHVLSIMKLSNSPCRDSTTNSGGAENVYSDGRHPSMVVDNNTYNQDPTENSKRDSLYGSLYGSLSSATESEEEDETEMMEDGCYTLPKSPRRPKQLRNSLIPPDLPPRDSGISVPLIVNIPEENS